MDSKYGTKLVETDVLLAVLNGDGDTADEILRGMLPSELARLRRAAGEVAERCRLTARSQRWRT